VQDPPVIEEDVIPAIQPDERPQEPIGAQP